jgi:hypothetical protein
MSKLDRSKTFLSEAAKTTKNTTYKFMTVIYKRKIFMKLASGSDVIKLVTSLMYEFS